MGEPTAWISLPQDSPAPPCSLPPWSRLEEVKVRVVSFNKQALNEYPFSTYAVKQPDSAGHSEGKPQTCTPNPSHVTSTGSFSPRALVLPRKSVKETHYPGLLWEQIKQP